MTSELNQTDVLIIGSGVAGLTTALELSDHGTSSVVLTRSDDINDCNTSLAQGGIIYQGKTDTPELLAADIKRAGAGWCHDEAVEKLVNNGPDILKRFLIDRLHVPFDQESNQQLARCQEAAHSIARIIHVQDATGQAIQDALIRTASENPLITVLTKHTAIDLITPDHHSTDSRFIYPKKNCIGAYVLDRNNQTVKRFISQFTVLASGGLGDLFLHSSNPRSVRGDGLAMANRAGARIINAEFVQFHPTTFFQEGAPNFLVSEAVRGAGAQLVHSDGQAFMHRYDPQWKDLAPRDVVSRAIFNEMTQHDTPCVYLDLKSHMRPAEIGRRFPNIQRFCLRFGVDICKQLIPVTPAAHYSCGGIWVDRHGQSDIDCLYAAGEVACTGVHGANRLASTSLLEGVVAGVGVASHINSRRSARPCFDASTIPLWQGNESQLADEVLVQHDMQRIQAIMWNYVGVSRTGARLFRALRELRNLETEIEHFYRNNRVNDSLIGLRNAVRTALIITLAAWSNKNSVGCHFREDDQINYV